MNPTKQYTLGLPGNATAYCRRPVFLDNSQIVPVIFSRKMVQYDKGNMHEKPGPDGPGKNMIQLENHQGVS